jgi:hypothetical protein
MFDQVLSVAERNHFLYTHPIADVACYNVFRWTTSADVQKKDITVCGTLFSNLGNGVELRVIRWNDDSRYDVLGTFNTKDLTVGQCGTVEFVLPLRPGEVGKHLDFVLHNAGSYVCDATAVKIRAYSNVQQTPAQTDVTDKVQARFHNRLVTPLGPYAELFGTGAQGGEQTLKIKLNYWRNGVVKHLELPRDSALELR